MKKILILCFLIFNLIFISCTSQNIQNKSTTNISNISKIKFKICPDEWIKNKMPLIIDDKNSKIPIREYFIINNKREELINYDLIWIKKNCKINSSKNVY